MRVEPWVPFHALGRDTVGLVVHQGLLRDVIRRETVKIVQMNTPVINRGHLRLTVERLRPRVADSMKGKLTCSWAAH